MVYLFLRQCVARLERRLVSLEWAAWLVLLVSLGLGVGQQIGSPLAGGGVGVGWRSGDFAMTVLVCLATIVQATTQIRYPQHGGALERFARWLMVCVSLVFSARFVYMLWTHGDIYAPPITLLAFSTYAVAQILHSLAVVGQESLGRAA